MRIFQCFGGPQVFEISRYFFRYKVFRAQRLFFIVFSGSQRFVRPVARQKSGTYTLRMIVKILYIPVSMSFGKPVTRQNIGKSALRMIVKVANWYSWS